MSTRDLSIYVLANAAQGPGLSGGDRIFIEWARRWVSHGHKLTICVWEEGYEMCKRNKLKGVTYRLWSAAKYKRLGFYALYIVRILTGLLEALRCPKPNENENILVYSSSDFLTDVLPALIMKKKFKNAKWAAGFYMFISLPLVFRNFDPQSKLKAPKLKHLAYHFFQRISHLLIRTFANAVFVTSKPDIHKFVCRRLPPERVVAVRGGVDVKTPLKVPEPPYKKYDAVFLGRFHPQKGILGLIEIWKIVCEVKKNAKLAMIGSGAENTSPEHERKVKEKISSYHLEENIDLFGFMDGVEKMKIFKASKLFLYPSTYGSGGMATGEAMACGLPAASFDLPHLRTYYPKGLVRAPRGDHKAFAENILTLLENEELYNKVQKDALDLMQEWDWDKRAEKVSNFLVRLFDH